MSLAAQVTATGIVAPSYADILASLKGSFATIYGSDAYIDDDSQDGQMLAIFAQGIYDCNQTLVAVYNSFSPTFAQGAGLSSVVKINGIRRQASSNSTATVTIVGQGGTVLDACIVGDDLGLGTQWTIPDGTTINVMSGDVSATATCTTPGAIAVPAGHIVKILTPTRGWQSVTNPADAVPGAPVEDDATLRQRQAASTALPSQTPLQGIFAAVDDVPNVQRLKIYENDTSTPDGNGIPGHSIAVVVEGGDVVAIATAIAEKKCPGTGTYGTTTEVIIDPAGVPNTIGFFELGVLQIDVTVNGTALPGYVSTTGTLIQQAVAAFLTGLDIGEDSYIFRLASPAQLAGDAATGATGMTQAQLDALAATYVVTSITQAFHGNSQSASNLTIDFNQAAACVVVNVTINIS